MWCGADGARQRLLVHQIRPDPSPRNTGPFPTVKTGANINLVVQDIRRVTRLRDDVNDAFE